jgi:hypothetical protein
LASAAVADTPARARAIHAAASVSIRAPRERVFGLYAHWQGWPQIFGATIRGVRCVNVENRTLSLDVDHVEGHVPNRMSIISPELIVLEERKRRYDARFENHFEASPGGTRYVVTADVTLRGPLRALRFIAKPIIVARIRRFVLEPLRRAAEGV